MINDLEIILRNRNIKAFLDMIRHSEGTATPNGYRTMFGGKLFDKFDDHPHIFFAYKNKIGQVIKTSAAGAYQITWTTWVGLKKGLGLKDFSPESQDLAAVELIRGQNAIADIMAGNFLSAIARVRHIWASLPGAGCNQPEHSMADVEKWYENAGGEMLAA